MENYTIYVGRRCVAKLRATLAEATAKWDEIADSLEAAGTCTLYEGKRNIDNQCAQQVIQMPRQHATRKEKAA